MEKLEPTCFSRSQPAAISPARLTMVAVFQWADLPSTAPNPLRLPTPNPSPIPSSAEPSPSQPGGGRPCGESPAQLPVSPPLRPGRRSHLAAADVTPTAPRPLTPARQRPHLPRPATPSPGTGTRGERCRRRPEGAGSAALRHKCGPLPSSASQHAPSCPCYRGRRGRPGESGSAAATCLPSSLPPPPPARTKGRGTAPGGGRAGPFVGKGSGTAGSAMGAGPARRRGREGRVRGTYSPARAPVRCLPSPHTFSPVASAPPSAFASR